MKILQLLAISVGGVFVVAAGVVLGSLTAFELLEQDLRWVAAVGQPVDVCGLAQSYPCHIRLDAGDLARLQPSGATNAVPLPSGPVEVFISSPVEVFTSLPVEVVAPFGAPLAVEVENDLFDPVYVDIVR